MLPVRVTFSYLHVPQRCRHNHQQVFVESERVAVFASYGTVLRYLSLWSGGCHVYEVRKVEVAEPKAEIEFV